MTWIRRGVRTGAWAVVLLALVLPVAAMVVRSFHAQRVTLANGDVVWAVGEITRTNQQVTFDVQQGPGKERLPVRLAASDVQAIDTVATTRHYDAVFADLRTRALLGNSLWIAIGAATLALLLGLPLAWVLARTDLAGRTILGWIALVPALLPPFFMALGGARTMQSLLVWAFGLTGASLQRWNSVLVLGLVCTPLALLLIAPALREVPAGLWEAARLQGGPRGAFRTVTRPAVLPAIVATWLLAFVLSLADFAVPDLLGFMLPAGGAPAHVFATEVLLQWKQHDNAGRAVATAAPLVAVTFTAVLVALWLLRRSPVFADARGQRRRALRRLSPRGRVAAYMLLAALLVVSVGVPFAGIVSWAGTGGESAAAGAAGTPAAGAQPGALFDLSGALDRTAGSRPERDRWIKAAAGAALLSMLVSVVLVRQALRGPPVARWAVVAVGALALAVPGLVLSVGSMVLQRHGPNLWPDGSLAPSILVLTARFFAVALMAAWLALRALPRSQEDVAALCGADAWVQTTRIWGPRAAGGILAGGLLVGILALRRSKPSC